jgi:hypothetical protein
MLRKARIDAPGALHHVIIRGIERRKIFRSDRVAEVLEMPPAQVTAFGKSPQTVKARSLLCFWAYRRLGMRTIEIASKLGISQPAVSRSSKRGEQTENEHRFELIPQKV